MVIKWRITTSKHVKDLDVGIPGSFLKIMYRGFGFPPFSLGKASTDMLMGMHAVFDADESPFIHLARLVGLYGDIVVWPEIGSIARASTINSKVKKKKKLLAKKIKVADVKEPPLQEEQIKS